MEKKLVVQYKDREMAYQLLARTKQMIQKINLLQIEIHLESGNKNN